MRELAHFLGPFAKFKDKRQKLDSLIESVCQVVEKVRLKGVADLVILADVEQFKAKTGVALSGLSFCIACSLMKMYTYHKDVCIEVCFDYMEKPHKRVQEAFRYLRHDRDFSVCAQFVTMIPGRPKDSEKVPGLQIADFLSYEAFRSSQAFTEWLQTNPNSSNCLVDWLEWLGKQQPRRIHWTRERQSGLRLAQASALDSSCHGIEQMQGLHYRNLGKWS